MIASSLKEGEAIVDLLLGNGADVNAKSKHLPDTVEWSPMNLYQNFSFTFIQMSCSITLLFPSVLMETHTSFGQIQMDR